MARVRAGVSASVRPLVSIGMPTYNGSRFIAEALESLLAQTYANFEILVSDNASTDDTVRIVRTVAARDRRVTILRNDTNIGPVENFNRVFHQTSGALFMWAADDDRWEPEYLSSCVRALEDNPSAVQASTGIRFIDAETDAPREDHGLSLYDNPDLSSSDPAVRILRLMSRGGWYQVYGLTRRSVLGATRLFTGAFGSDVVLTLELAARGPFVLVRRPLYVYRVATPAMNSDRGAWNQSVVNIGLARAAPYTSLQEACSRAVSQSGLGWWQALRARAAIVAACYVLATPMRSRTNSEVRIRLAIARQRRDLGSLMKYSVLFVATAARRVAKRIRSRLN